VDPTRYRLAEHTAATLVWIGTSSTLKGLGQIRPLLNDVGRDGQGIRLKVICDRGLDLDDLPVDFVPWRERDEAEELATADIGISWLPRDSWSEGKCGLKVLQYMAAGLPVVANPVGVQREMVRHGENGFLVETAAQWREAIHRLAVDAPLRRQMGRAGRRRLEADYSLTRGAGIWHKVLKRMAQPATR
jgi:glycosyltransferase involved in cell wall biosynthesis